VRRFLVTFRKDLSRHLREPVGLLLWALVPLVVGTLIFLAFGAGRGVHPTAHLLVDDEDGTLASSLLVGAFRQGPLAEFIDVEEVGREEGEARMDEGDASALLILPEGLGRRFLHEEPSTLTLVTNPAQRILPRIVEEGVGTLADLVFYLQRLFGHPVRAIAAAAEAGEQPDTAKLSASFQDAGERLGRYLEGPAIVMERKERAASPPTVDMDVLFLPGLAIMGLLFACQGIADDLWRERRYGTLRRAVTSPLGAGALLAGKLGAGLVVLAGVSAAVLGVGAWAAHLPAAVLPAAWAWTLVGGLVFLELFAWLHLHASSQRAGAVLANAVLFPLLMVGGSFFPTELMPEWLAAVGRRTPNGQATEVLKDLLLGRAEVGPVLVGVVVCLGLALLLFPVVRGRLEKVAAEAGS
jgi:ABC-type Na+ efflux pump permease subunit